MTRSFRNRLAISVVSAGVAMGWASAAWAQHAKFTLMGESNSPGLSLEPQRRAVHPISAPYYHEDSFVTTDARAWFVYHDIPNSIALDGGSAKVYALQLRLAVNDQIQIVAYKDGYLDWDTGLIQDDGWNDLAAGLKWNFLQNWEKDFHAAVGAGYQFAVGDPSVLQNDQEARFWASVNKGFGNLHLGGTLNYLVNTGHEDALGNSDRIT